MDEPFFNFDSEEMDDEELYCESLLEELKKQQVRRENDSWEDCYFRWNFQLPTSKTPESLGMG